GRLGEGGDGGERQIGRAPFRPPAFGQAFSFPGCRLLLGARLLAVGELLCVSRGRNRAHPYPIYRAERAGSANGGRMAILYEGAGLLSLRRRLPGRLGTRAVGAAQMRMYLP